MQTTDRNLVTIIDKMLEVIPPDQTRLIYDLKNCRSSAEFAAPEMQRQWWRITAELLTAHVGNPSLAWHHMLVTIFTGVAPS